MREKQSDVAKRRDEALEHVLVQVQLHEAQGEKLRQLDLSKVLSARLMRADERTRES